MNDYNMQSAPVKTFRSRQRFVNDPQHLVDLTNRQHAAYIAINASMKRFLAHLSLTTSSYHQLQDDMLQCLDLSWEATEKIDNTIASIMSSLKECSTNLNQNLSTPIKEQLDGHKAMQSELKQWKLHSSKLNRRLKTLESTQTRKKTEAKLEKAIFRAEDATTLCQENASELCPSLVRLNTQGIQACCKTWMILCQSFNKLNNELPSLFTELHYRVKLMHNQAARGQLPAWMETNHKSSRVRVSTLGYLNSTYEAGSGPIYEGLRANLESTRESYYSRPAEVIPKRKPKWPEHNRRLYSDTSRASSDHSYAVPSLVNARSNSVGALPQSRKYRESSDRDSNTTKRAVSMEEYELRKTYDQEKVIILPPPPIRQNNSTAQSPIRSRKQRSPSSESDEATTVSAKPVRFSISYENNATNSNHQRERNSDTISHVSHDPVHAKRSSTDQSNCNGDMI